MIGSSEGKSVEQKSHIQCWEFKLEKHKQTDKNICTSLHAHHSMNVMLLYDLTPTLLFPLRCRVNLFCPLPFSFLAPGGTRIDDGDKTKMTNHCVFSAKEDHETIRNHAQVEPIMYC